MSVVGVFFYFFFSYGVVVKEESKVEERREGERKRTETRELHHTKHCLLFRFTTAGAAKAAEIVQSERGEGAVSNQARWKMPHSNSNHGFSLSFVLVDSWPVSSPYRNLLCFSTPKSAH